MDSRCPADRLPVGVLCGPTGSGKSARALELAARLPIEIVSVDSAQVYVGLDIGTAKPDAATRALVPHHLLDLRDPAQSYCAGDFVTDALAAIEAIHARGRLPLLVGGTLLYVRALLRGLAVLPRASPELRSAIALRALRLGWAALHAELQRIDPLAAERIHPNDPQRIQRALEVHALTGQPISALQAGTSGAADRYAWLCAALIPGDRAGLRAALTQRFERMLADGFPAEVRRLHRRGDLHAGLPAIRAVGYRQLWEWCEGRASLEAAGGKAIAATAQLAKRQLTWLRSESDYLKFDPQSGTCSSDLRSLYLPAVQRLQQLRPA